MKTTLSLLAFALYSSSLFAVDLSVSPLFTYGNYQRFDEVTNLTRSGEDAVVLSDDSAEGYQLLSTRKIYASLGPQILSSIELDNGTYGYVALGLYPSYNSYAKHLRSFTDSAELSEFSFSIPKSSADLTALKVSDAVYWNSQGGLTVNLTFGMGVAGAGPKVSIEGGHSVYVERKSEKEVYVEVRRLSTKSWGFVAGAMIAYAEAGKLVEQSRGLSFLIDFTTPEGSALYESLIRRGRADLLQESPLVRSQIGEVTALKALSAAKAAIAVPFIPVIEFKRETGEEVVEEERSDIWDRNSQLTRAVSYKQRSSRLFRKQEMMETAALVSEETVNGVTSSRTQLHWFRKGNRFKIHRLAVALEKLKQQTGMDDELSINFPTENGLARYAKVEFSLRPSQKLATALAQRAGASTPAQRARALQKFWNGPKPFRSLLESLSACGGEWTLEISGEKIRRLIKGQTFPEKENCQI